MRVGLTGGVASGKSTVSAILQELGAVVVDSDQLARDVVAPGTPGLARVVAEFGEGMLTAAGELDRAKLAEMVFADAEARRSLEEIVHPLVGEASTRLEAAAPPGALVVHDIPLLVEAGMAPAFDVVIVVDTPVDQAVRRMVDDRGWTEAEARARIGAQATREQRLARARIGAQATREQRLAVATYVVDNGGTREGLRSQVESLYRKLVAG